jgi:hypothetical protein
MSFHSLTLTSLGEHQQKDLAPRYAAL